MVGAFLALFVVCVSASLTFQVEPKSQECFMQPAQRGDRIEFDFEVTRGGLLDIKVRVMDPHDQPLHDALVFFNRREGQPEESGKVNVEANTNGEFKICFDNRMSRWTAKVVTFSMGGNFGVKDRGHEEIAKLEHLSPVVDSVLKIEEELTQIDKTQRHLRVLATIHSRDSASANSWMQYVAMGESALLILASIVQYRCIRNWFSTDSRPTNFRV